jgi:cob(I)alamin adenosyltransferase
MPAETTPIATAPDTTPIHNDSEVDEEVGAGSSRKSLLIVNTGHGKGKSSAAFGVMSRGWARGWTVAVVQYIKSGSWNTGEHKLATHLGIEWHEMGDGFTWDSTDMDETEALGRAAWAATKEMLANGNYDLLILDELTYLMTFGWVPVADVVDALTNRHARTNVVVTGRDAPDELIAIADTVTEMRKVKHAYDQGINARKGIEY